VLGGLVAAALIGALLVLQSARNGWPFSLDHLGSTLPPVSSAAQSHETHGADFVDAPAAAPNPDSRTSVTVDAAQLDRLGVRFEPVRLEAIATAARHVATVAPDEGRISHMHARVAGWIEELYVDTTGVRVRQGQPVAAIFSQELFASQTEYLAVLRQTGDTPSSVVVEAARTRLAVLGMGEREIRALEREGAAPRLVTITAPHDGTVLRRGVSVGTAIDPSTELMTIADLSEVWVLAEVPEAYVGGIVPGTRAMLEFPAAGATPLTAAVDFIYPTLTERTRSVRVRFVLPNPDGALRPGMYGTALFDAGGREALTIPRDAVVETGASQHVFVQTQDQALEPRQVRIGVRLADRVEILEGLLLGEQVVSSGVFLIDSESRLRASSAGTGHSGHGAGAAGEPEGQVPPTP
jgi:Cu(I)/Ag(I) efflux system membrane fusion protein